MQGLDKLEVTKCDVGAVLPVKAVPGASGDRIAGVLGSRLKVAVAAAAEKGKANKAIARVLADALGVAARAVRLRKGQTSPIKEFVVTGMTPDQIRERLLSLGGPRPR